MPQDRFFIDAPLHLGDEYVISGDEHHHLHVMRKKEGEEIEIINGKNVFARAEILKNNQKETIVKIAGLTHFPAPSYQIILAQAIPKLNRLETIIEKGTELGVTTFWLFPGDKSEKKILSANDQNRLYKIAISSMKQCGRYDLPAILQYPPLTSQYELPFPAYFGSLGDDCLEWGKVWDKKSGVIFFTGPESGFSPQEISTLNNLSVRPVSLHRNILRTDTASITALSLINYFNKE